MNSALVARAGDDQETIVGSYAILDATQSTGAIDWYEWEQDVENPDTVKMFSGNDNAEELVGFVKQGVYKFRLTVKSGEDTSNQDEVQVTVSPNPHSRFKDPNLEIIVRTALRNKKDDLNNNHLAKLDSLKYYPTPEKISSLSGIELCTNIQYLLIGHQRISNIEPLRKMVKMRDLDLNQNRLIKDISPLENMVNLESLVLFGNQISDLSSLKNMKEIRYLNLRNNGEIKNIESLSNMYELKELRMSDAELSDLSPIQNLTKLEVLWFTKCNVTDISYLIRLVNIRNLKVSWANVDNLSALSNMKNLEWLALEQNKISDISALQNLPNLSYLRLWDNLITNIKPLVDNPNIGEGDIVGLDSNPLDEKSISEYIPVLQTRGVAVTW